MIMGYELCDIVMGYGAWHWLGGWLSIMNFSMGYSTSDYGLALGRTVMGMDQGIWMRYDDYEQ